MSVAAPTRAGRPANGATVTAQRRRSFPVAGWIGGGLVGIFILAGMFGPSVAGYSPVLPSGGSLEPPSAAHLLGTNQNHLDLASQMLHGARVSLMMAVLAGAGTVFLGLVVGVAAGWRTGGRLDHSLMALVDLMVATPRLPLMLLIGTYVGQSVLGMAVLMSVVAWPGPSRMIRGHVRSLRRRLHVVAASSFGSSTAQILRRHFLPELTLVSLTAFIGAAGRAVMFETGLSFLGLGDPARVSWGAIIRDASGYGNLYRISAYLWWMVPPLSAIVLVLLGFTLLGTAVEHRVNPRLARHHGRSR